MAEAENASGSFSAPPAGEGARGAARRPSGGGPDQPGAAQPAAQPQTSDLQVLQKIGRGSEAVVYKCRQVSMDRIVAVKFLLADAAGDAESCRRFVQEARHAACLAHPNIVTTHDIRSFRNTFCIVMEYFAGGSLADLLASRGRLAPAEAAAIARQAAEALRYAHDRGFIHRDIKPKNILLTGEGVAKIADMGIACHQAAAAESDGQWKAYGTPYYMSPEQVTGDPPPDFRTDLYSLGATLYEMVTGRPPFIAPTPQEIMRKQVIEPLADPRTLVPDLPETLCRLLAKALAKEPEDRYQSAADFIQALDQLVLGPASAGPSPAEGHRPAAFVRVDDLPVAEEVDEALELEPGQVIAAAPDVLVSQIADLAQAQRHRGRRVEMLTQKKKDAEPRAAAGREAARAPAKAEAAAASPQDARRRAKRKNTIIIAFAVFVVLAVVAAGLLVWRFGLGIVGEEAAAPGTGMSTPPGGRPAAAVPSSGAPAAPQASPPATAQAPGPAASPVPASHAMPATGPPAPPAPPLVSRPAPPPAPAVRPGGSSDLGQLEREFRRPAPPAGQSPAAGGGPPAPPPVFTARTPEEEESDAAEALRMAREFERDPAATEWAKVGAYDDVAKWYPHSKAAKDARAAADRLRKQAAGGRRR